jgi:hypothetical protein
MSKDRCHIDNWVKMENKQVGRDERETACPPDLTEQINAPSLAKSDSKKGSEIRKRDSLHCGVLDRTTSKNHPLLNHPLWLVVDSTSRY